MRDLNKLSRLRVFSLITLAAVVLCDWAPALAEPPQRHQFVVQPATPRHSDALPQPPTPTLEPQTRQAPTIHGERPGYWQSPESTYRPQYPYPPHSYHYYHRGHWRRPSRYLPHYRTYGNRRGSGYSRW